MNKNKLKNFCILNIIVASGFIILIGVFVRFDFLSCFALSVVAKQLPKAIKNLQQDKPNTIPLFFCIFAAIIVDIGFLICCYDTIITI